MNQYFFILGNNATLSTAEVMSILNGFGQKFDLKELTKDFLIIKTLEELEVEKIQQRLGGTIKIGEIIQVPVRINANFDTNNIREISDELVKISERSKKVYYGFSFYNQLINKKNIKILALKIKKILKEKGISSRWVESKENILSSVIIQKNKLLISGAEFVFLKGKNDYLGKTISCQEFEEYENLDFGRPSRLIDKLGMMPPKLAKIMINLSQSSTSNTILDPFCGSGTILQEAILKGYKNIIGIDIDEKAIKSSQENIRWLLENSKFKIQNSKLQLKIEKEDVRNLSQKLSPDSIDAIVTEPYLGPIKINNYKLPIAKLIDELSDLYLTTFKEFKKILKPAGKIVIILPIYKFNNQSIYLPILEELKKSGWQIINPIPEELKKNPIIKITDRNSIVYSRPNQTVLREIFIFKHGKN